MNAELFQAWQQLTQTPSLGRVKKGQLQEFIFTRLRTIVTNCSKSFELPDKEAHVETVTEEIFLRLIDGSCHSTSVGEWINFIRTCTHHMFVTLMRGQKPTEPIQEEQEDFKPPSKHTIDHHTAYDWIVAQETLKLLDSIEKRILQHILNGPNSSRVTRARKFFAYRLNPTLVEPANRDTPLAKKQADAVYQDRSTGRKYAMAAADELQWNEEEGQLLKLLFEKEP